jgi:2',3'-cyclic-nucleotide 2'-phosphodiesterase (5'-nucleotidase family)
MHPGKFLFILFITLLGCKTPNVPFSLSYTNYKIAAQKNTDTALVNLLQPYSGDVSRMMKKVIGFSNTTMYKKQPESVLGNFMADCIKEMAEIKYQTPVDIGFMNQGGIRSEINKGNITLGNIYELMPFDNLVVIQQVKGEVLEKFIQRIAADGGWPISKNSSFKIQTKKAQSILINGKPLDVNATYTVANTDYIANGGSNAEMLKGIPMQNRGYLLRDALVDYIEVLTKQGKPVDGKLENRVSLVNE